MSIRTLLSPVAPTDRVGRYPKHSFRINALPFTATPFMLAPVLPGETMTNMFFESRVVSDPVKNSIIGWKKEYYFFYVRVTDMLQDAIRDMFIDPNNVDLMATLGVAANKPAYYQAKGGIDYLQRCLKSVVENYFRDEGETYLQYKTADDMPMVQIRDTFWMDSLTDKDVMPQGPNIASATTAGDLDRLMDAFEQLRALGIANMTYEDFLRGYGIAVPNKDEAKPEMLARFSDYQYPSNTIDPLTGAPSSAVSWVFKNGNKENKFFKEPGFVIGISVTRPKVYFSGLAGSLASFMGRAWDWMPNYLAAMPETSLKHFPQDTGPLGDRTVTDGYWVDMRDLLLYGDQYQNHTPFDVVPATNGDEHMLALPTGDTFNFKNPSEDMAKSFFKTVGKERIKQDGYVSLSIKGAQVDYTVGNMASV